MGKLFMVDLAGTERASQVHAVCRCAEVETQAFKFLMDARFYSPVPSLVFHQNKYLSSSILHYSFANNVRLIKEFEHVTFHMTAKTSQTSFVKFKHS